MWPAPARAGLAPAPCEPSGGGVGVGAGGVTAGAHRGAGEALREGMLRHGGAREPGAILRDMLGDGALMTDPVGAAPDPTSMLADLNRGR